MPVKTKLDQLKGNVEAQESRLEEGMKMLNEAKKESEQETAEKQQQPSVSSEWDALERVIGLMDDLLNSYRTYTKELEKRNKWLSRRSGTTKSEEKVEE